MILKADMHIHAAGDPDDDFISYTVKDAIDYSKKIGLGIISITAHDGFLWTPMLGRYASKKGVVLVPGCEKEIEGRHVLLYNFSKKEAMGITTFEDLRKAKRSHHAVCAPHPYFPHPAGCALGEKLLANIDLFDAIEVSFMYMDWLDCNKKAVMMARQHHKALLANSDSHCLTHIGRSTHTLIDVKERTPLGVVEAIKKGKTRPISTPLPLHRFVEQGIWMMAPNRIKPLYTPWH